MKRHRPRFSLLRSTTGALCLIALMATAPARDIVTLKSGEKLVGTIEDRNAGEITIKYQVTPSISDIKTVPRDEIESIESENEDDIAFKELEGLLPTPDLLTEAGYTERLNKLRAFLDKFPTSRYKLRVESMLGTLQAEQAKVLEGSRKLDGEWIDAEEFERNRFAIDAQVALNEVKDAAEAGHYLKALRAFSDFESEFGHSTVYPEGVTLIRDSVLPAYRAQLEELESQLPRRIEEREKVGGLVGAEKQQTEAAIARELEAWETLRAREEAEDLVWRSVYAYSEEDIEEALKTTEKEAERLSKLNVSELAAAAESTAKAYAAFRDGRFAEAKNHLDTAQARGAKFDALDTFEEEIEEAEKAKEEADEKLKEQMEAAAADPGFDPLGDVSGTGEGEGEGTPADDNGDTPESPGDTDPADEADEETDADEAGDDEASEEEDADDERADRRAEAAGADGGDGTFRLILIGVLILVVVGLVAARFLVKPKGDDIEG